MESVDVLSPLNQKQKEPTVNFLQIDHSDENAPSVWGKARKDDIILLENTDLSEKERTEEEKTINQISLLKDPTQRKLKLGNLFSENDFVSQIIRNSIIEGKEFHYIDLDLGGPGKAATLSRESKDLFNKASNLFDLGLFDQSFVNFQNSAIANATRNLIREDETGNQISNLIKSNKDFWSGKSIAVIQGLMHSKSYRFFKQGNPNIKTGRILGDKPRFTFPVNVETERRLLYGSYRDRTNMLKRLFIEQFLIFPLVSNSELSNEKSVQKSDNVVRSLSHEEVETIFSSLKTIQEKLDPIRRVTKDAVWVYANRYTSTLQQQIIEMHPII